MIIDSHQLSFAHNILHVSKSGTTNSQPSHSNRLKKLLLISLLLSQHRASSFQDPTKFQKSNKKTNIKLYNEAYSHILPSDLNKEFVK